LTTIVPSRDAIQQGIRTVHEKMEKRAGSHVAELDMLKKALAAEIETGNFYKKMVAELDSTGQQLFERFLEIEEGHQTVVQAEIDSLSGFGFWLDFREFSPEAG
jgi:rubrerythrin